MNQDRDRGQAGADPDERAFTGNPDGPPQEPDHKPAEDAELIRSGRRAIDEGQGEDGPGSEDARGEYGNLPGYGG
jgi:hypothetical protein